MKFNLVKIFLLICLAVTTGFLQENLKVNVNYILEIGDKIPEFFNQTPQVKEAWLEQVKIDAPYDYYHNHNRIELLFNFSRPQLMKLKWIMTIVFVLIFLVFNGLFIKWITKDNRFVRWTIWLYLFFFGFSFVFYLVGHYTGTSIQAYGVSRKIVGGLQSLVPLMILLPASWLIKHDNTISNHEKNS